MTGRRKETATRLLRCRTWWRPWERPVSVGAAAMYSHAVAPVGAQRAVAAGLYGAWRRCSESGCCAGQRRFRKGQVTRRDSVARYASFGNWRLAAEEGQQMAWSVTTDFVS